MSLNSSCTSRNNHFTTLLLLLFSSFLWVDALPSSSRVVQQQVRWPCLMQHCSKRTTQCLLHSGCRSLLTCLSECSRSRSKLKNEVLDPYYKRCTMECNLKAPPDPSVTQFIQCLVKNACIIPGHEVCPQPQLFHQPTMKGEQTAEVKMKQVQFIPEPVTPTIPEPVTTTIPDVVTIDLERLQGRWWVVRGLSPLYDCWRCQSMNFQPFASSPADPVWNYTYTLELEHQVYRIPCTIRLQQQVEVEAFPQFEVHYQAAHGMVQGRDEWSVLAVSENHNFILLYYCGSSPIDSYRGAIVMARQPIQPNENPWPTDVQVQFDEALQHHVQLRLTDFCVNDNTHCVPL